MSVLSGFGGAVGSVDTVRDWKISSSADLAAFVASNTVKGTGRLDGNYDWTGSYTCYGHTPVNFSGDAVSIILSLDGAVGVTGEIVISEVTLDWDVEGAGIISHNTTFEGDGAIGLGAAVASDSTIPNPPSAAGCGLFTGTLIDAPVFTEITDIRTMSLTLTAATPSYSSSGTYADGKPRIKRLSGGVIDASISWTTYQETGANLLVPGDVHVFKLGVDPGATPTKFWEIRWMRVDEASDFGADIEGSGLVAAAQGASLDAFNQVPITKTGKITDPAGAVRWSAA